MSMSLETVLLLFIVTSISAVVNLLIASVSAISRRYFRFSLEISTLSAILPALSAVSAVFAAVCAALFAKSFELLSQSAEDNIAYERVVDALQVLTNSCINICEGQALDMAFEDTFNVTKDEYMNMIYKKTGDLITASTTIGAIMGGASSNEIQALRTYGKQIGLAFQIQDDYIDLTGDESIGKPVGSDLVEGKKTLMVVYALEKANKEDHDRLVELLEANDESIIPEAMEILEKYGAINYARSKAYDCVIESKQALSILPDSDAKDALFKLADFVFTRKS